MLPSEKLREIISKRIDIDLNQYAWNMDFKTFIFSIELEKYLEDKVSYLDEVFKLGLNIGHCGLTAKYLVVNIPNAELYYGKLPALTGTKNSPTGGHAWVVFDNFVIDTSLMISLSVQKAKELGYIFEKRIDPRSARIFSEYDLFSNELFHYQKDPEAFTKQLTLIQSKNKVS